MIAFAPLSTRWLHGALATAFMLGACGGGGGEAAPGVVVNRAPQVTSAPATTASVGVPYVYEAKASDPEGGALAWSLTQAPAGMSIGAAGGLVTWTPAPAQAGNQAVVLRVVDPAGLAATQSFSIAVTAANAAPRITNTPPATAVVGALYRHQIEASDPDGDALAFTLDAGPDGLGLDGATGILGWTPRADQLGNHAVTLRVADARGLSATQSFTLTVVAGRAPPQITSVPVTTALVGALYRYVVRAVDPNGDAFTLSLLQAPAGMSIDAASGAITWTPAAQQTGAQAVTVRAADAGGLATTQVFSVAVGAANVAPQITSAPVTAATTGQPYSYLVVAADPDGDPLAYSLLQGPAGMTLDAASGLLGWTPTAAQAGSHAVSVRAADPAGLAATQSFAIAVAPANAAPQITTAAVTSAVAGTAYRYDVDALDPNGDVLAYALVQAPAGMTIEGGSGVIAWAPSAAQAGTHAVVVRVADPRGLAATQSFSIIVALPNVAAVITSSPVLGASVGAPYVYKVIAADANGDVLAYSLAQAPAGMGIDSRSGVIAWTPSYAQVGRQAVTVRVVDPGGLAATQSFDVVVGGTTRADMATPADTKADAGGTATISLNWVRVPTAADTLQFMHLVSGSGQVWSVDDHWTASATWAAGAFTEARTITVPAGLPAGTYDIRVGLSGGNPWGNFALAAGAGVTDPAGDHRYRVGTLTVEGTSAGGSMQMACADGAGWQCSGQTVLRTDRGVALTRSGVQAYGRSTSDRGATNPNRATAFGLAVASGGVAEIRVRKDGNAAPVDAAVLLSDLDIFWSGQQNRPQIIETFNPTAGRVFLEGSGALGGGGLPPSSDLDYYDFARLGTAGTRENYANNRYFPRAAAPRCVPGGWCSTYETTGLQFGGGSWRSGGSDPDRITGMRNHEDGDVHAGNGLPDGNGNPTLLPGASGFGVPMPGSKGYRTLDHWSYRYGNLASWFTEDTVSIAEWGGINEHNKNRRGFVAFGDTTDPAAVPGSGTATYFGIVRLRYTANGSSDPALYSGQATVVVNFASRTVTVSIQGTPVDMTATATLASGANANYLQGPAASGGLSGGLGGRLFGPMTGGGAGSAPAEIGGAFSLTNGNAAVVGGFIARLQ
ncbi:MAG: putative Ig domain-containing protein [Rubrivivax sp.]|nr:putative Ig domain-containing protein [Rubrivivax sp.]